jgi:hypothetical protein
MATKNTERIIQIGKTLLRCQITTIRQEAIRL